MLDKDYHSSIAQTAVFIRLLFFYFNCPDHTPSTIILCFHALFKNSNPDIIFCFLLIIFLLASTIS